MRVWCGTAASPQESRCSPCSSRAGYHIYTPTLYRPRLWMPRDLYFGLDRNLRGYQSSDFARGHIFAASAAAHAVLDHPSYYTT